MLGCLCDFCGIGKRGFGSFLYVCARPAIARLRPYATIHYHCWLAGTSQTTLGLRGLTGVVYSGPWACAGAQAAHARHSLAAHAACCQPLRL